MLSILYCNFFLSEKKCLGVDFRHGWIQDTLHLSGFLSLHFGFIPSRLSPSGDKDGLGQFSYTTSQLSNMNRREGLLSQ